MEASGHQPVVLGVASWWHEGHISYVLSVTHIETHVGPNISQSGARKMLQISQYAVLVSGSENKVHRSPVLLTVDGGLKEEHRCLLLLGQVCFDEPNQILLESTCSMVRMLTYQLDAGHLHFSQFVLSDQHSGHEKTSSCAMAIPDLCLTKVDA